MQKHAGMHGEKHPPRVQARIHAAGDLQVARRVGHRGEGR